MISALYLEDDHLHASLVENALRKKKVNITSASSIKEGMERISQHRFDIVLTDLMLPDGTGIDFISAFKSRGKDVPVVIITGYPSIDTSVEALRMGVDDYLFKPVDIEQLEMKIKSLCFKDDVENGNENGIDTGKISPLVGDSPAMKDVKKRLVQVADSGVNILIQGETGVGKEVCARLIHDLGNRKEKPFVAVNCAALSGDLFSNELFGHAKGSYTGASEDKPGFMAASGDGTLLLDEIGEIDQRNQAKLLRAVELREYHKVGDPKPRVIRSRIITATNRELLDSVQSGTFRSDLYYRLNVFKIQIPPLRERKEDIPQLANFLINKHNLQYHISVEGVSDEAMLKLQGHNWPGNVRELQNLLLGAMIHRKSGYIQPEDFSIEHESRAETPSGTGEKDFIIQSIIRNNGDIEKVLQETGLSRSAFYRRTQKYGIKPQTLIP